MGATSCVYREQSNGEKGNYETKCNDNERQKMFVGISE